MTSRRVRGERGISQRHSCTMRVPCNDKVLSEDSFVKPASLWGEHLFFAAAARRGEGGRRTQCQLSCCEASSAAIVTVTQVVVRQDTHLYEGSTT